ncbi:MAG: PaaI family thioesterase [Dehalococcoidia bacterium]|nr:MAG: PaaI family thioesterase [bacterium]MCE7926956.1 PaaI family thioesterase [Chloroflexi bacterium CFX7]MCK6563325.1 PaaI family thioesterase [Dehalococcoidia bacterium]MCL4232170.1 PaaI family thioesterase [Dehalococcoidia bacterium]NUQ55331.1 PaaI family thioesterase [Dehalococcoidia bacterium]
MTETGSVPLSAEYFNAGGVGRLPGLLGLQITEVGPGLVRSRLAIRGDHMAPNGYLHAATVVALADTSCGYGAVANRPDGATGFTTIELKTNFLGTATEGAIACRATLTHGGRMTQVWDAEVQDEATGKAIALFRCTQMLLYPRG